jgi:hypothetical protein
LHFDPRFIASKRFSLSGESLSIQLIQSTSSASYHHFH